MLRLIAPQSFAIAAAVALASAQLGAVRPDNPKAGAPPATGAIRLIDEGAALLGTPQPNGACSAILPHGWTLRAGRTGDTADADGAGGRAHAAWGIRGVIPAMRGSYGDMFGPPDVAALATVSAVTHAQAQPVGTRHEAGSFTVQRWQAGTSVGTAVYRTYPAAVQGQYILSLYLAWVDSGVTTLLPTAEAVMASLNCQTRLRPPPPVEPGNLPRPGDRSRRTGSSRGDLADYNAQLGTQWAHSPTTGQHYLLDNSTQWNANGPDGPGYYRQAGNSVEKLEVGW